MVQDRFQEQKSVNLGKSSLVIVFEDWVRVRVRVRVCVWFRVWVWVRVSPSLVVFEHRQHPNEDRQQGLKSVSC